MKKFFICLVALSTISFISCNDDKSDSGTTKSETSKKEDVVAEADVPAAVTTAFKAKYPDATSVEWEKAKENDQPTFKAKWKSGDNKKKAEFAQDGSFIKED